MVNLFKETENRHAVWKLRYLYGLGYKEIMEQTQLTKPVVNKMLTSWNRKAQEAEDSKKIVIHANAIANDMLERL